MKTVQIYIVESKGQHDEITTPALYTYKVFGTMKDAQDHLDSIYNNLRTNPELSPIRGEFRVDTRNAYPRQYWHITTKFVTIPE